MTPRDNWASAFERTNMDKDNSTQINGDAVTTPAAPRSSRCYAVGDQLAFKCGYGRGHWEIAKIEKITPSGRIKCGRFTLNPDLSIRGDRGYSGPYRGEPVTDKIKGEYKRQRHLAFIARTSFEDLGDEVLDAVVAAIQSE